VKKTGVSNFTKKTPLSVTSHAAESSNNAHSAVSHKPSTVSSVAMATPAAAAAGVDKTGGTTSWPQVCRLRVIGQRYH